VIFRRPEKEATMAKPQRRQTAAAIWRHLPIARKEELISKLLFALIAVEVVAPSHERHIEDPSCASRATRRRLRSAVLAAAG
jgi:hypothetical protein